MNQKFSQKKNNFYFTIVTELSLKEFFEDKIKSLKTLINERDKQYDGRFKASETAVGAALLAQKTAVDAAFTASEKAIVKAEDAQKDYNQRSNEFRGQLEDQANRLISKSESSILFGSVEAKMESQQKQIDELLQNKAKLEGKANQSSVLIALLISTISIIIGVIGIISQFIK